MERGGESYFYHTDGLGSIAQITFSSKQVVASYTYDAFGNITSQSGSLANPYTFTGREYDQESGLYYYRARYYDPKIGRFLSTDPLDMAMVILIRQYLPRSNNSGLLYHYSISNPLMISNVYLYVGNNPVNWVDPLGLYLTPEQKLKVSLITGLGAFGGAIILGGPAGGAIGGALAAAVATYFMEGSTLTDVVNNLFIGGISGLAGVTIVGLLEGTLMSGMQVAVTTGVLSGMIDVVLLGADPLFHEACNRYF